MKFSCFPFWVAGFVAGMLLLAAPPATPAQVAQTPPAFGWPHSFTTYRMTAAYDLDRATGPRADYTGWRSGDPTAGSGHAYDNHTGSDTGLPNGTPLYAVANGTVESLRQWVPTGDTSGVGNYIITNHAVGAETYRVNFWHLDYQGALVGVGQSFVKGQHIAMSNNTGNSTGPHLHYGISRSSATNNYTCPFYHGWWESDEFYWGDTRPCLRFVKIGVPTLNCRTGNTTAYSLITSMPQDAIYVSTQHNSWHRVLLPLPPAKAHESRTATGALAPVYSETGMWQNATAKSAVADPQGDANRVELVAAGSRYSEFSGTGGSETATFTFTAPQRGNYKVMTTFPADANAANVTYRVAHSGGTTDVVVDQRGNAAPAGTGLHADPYIIATNPYIAHHTTVGGESIWDIYSPAGSTLSQGGPERIYKFEVRTNTRVRVAVAHAGYPALDIDIHLLGSMSNTNCLIRADWSFQYDLTPGTYYIAADTYQNATRATNYTLTVEFDETEPFPDSWVSLGEFHFERGTEYSVQIREDSVTGRIDTSRPGRVYADAIKVVPLVTHRSGFLSSDSAFSSVVNTSTTPICSVVVHTDRLAGNDSRDIADYHEVPVYALPGTGSTNPSPVVAKAVTGHRFVVTERTADGWYKVHLTNACDAPMGWIGGKDLYIYRPEAATLVDASSVTGWQTY